MGFESSENTEMNIATNQEMKSSPMNKKNWMTLIVGIVMLLVGVGVGYMGRGAFGPEAIAASGTATAVAYAVQTRAVTNQEVMKAIVAQTNHFRGDPNAPVTLIEFSDFQCPFCAKFASETGPQIDEMYVKSGKVRIGHFHFPFLGDESLWAAEASECAGDQGKYWEYYDYLFANHGGENQGAFSKENLKKFAQTLGLDSQAFDQCLDTGKFTSVVTNQGMFARQLGVQSTPSFIVNGTPLVGAQPFDTFKQLIDQFLNQ